MFLLPLLQNKQNKYIKIKDGIESLDGIKITEENLTVTVSGIGNLDAGTDYTYEVWLWVSEFTRSPQPSGRGKRVFFYIVQLITPSVVPIAVRMLIKV